MKKSIITLFLGVAILLSCKKETVKENTETSTKKENIATNLSEKIEIAHNKEAFLSHEAIKFNVVINFGGNEILNATISAATNSEYAIIEKKDGSKIYVNKENVFASPELKEDASVRFHAYTWSYFFLLPYKLNDVGTKWNFDYKTNETKNIFNTAKLSFEENIGDAPKDWYVIYANKNTNVLEQAAYIVTAGKTQEEAEKDPHAIKYENYELTKGIPIANNWSFWGWNNDDGITQKIGFAKISDIQFIKGFKNKVQNIPNGFVKK